MTDFAQRLKSRFYRNTEHPYEVFEREISSLIRPGDVLLDAGCGRTAPTLRKFTQVSRRSIGVDLVDPREVPPGIEYHQGDLAALPVESNSVDLIISRSVFEHLTDPDAVYRELFRLLKPGGHLVFLTANAYDYGTLLARLIPNGFHARIVKKVEGRPEEDTFPTAYKTNSYQMVRRLSENVGFRIKEFSYLNQYPNYFMFNGALFFVGMCYERLTSKINALRFLRGWILVTLEKPLEQAK